MCAARRLPAMFCVENNQTALSTPVAEQSAVRVFADKAAGYGIPGITIDGTDPDEIAAAFAWAVERARAGEGPALIELVVHAHVRPRAPRRHALPRQGSAGVVGVRAAHRAGLRGTASSTRTGPRAIRSPATRRGSSARASSQRGELDRLKREAEAIVEAQARAVIDAPWPAPDDAGVGVFADEPPRVRVEVLDRDGRHARSTTTRRCRRSRPGRAFDRKGSTFLEAVMLGVGDALRSDPRVFVYGEDVGGKYGNAFLLLRPLLAEFGDRIINSPLAEGAVLGVCVGAALAGQRPIGEIQFNDFVATGFNQLVNNAAKIRYRWGGSVPMVVRMPWGGLRHAGPVPLAEHRAVVLPDARVEDRRALDAARRARADGGGRRRSGSGAVLRAHRALSRSARSSRCSAHSRAGAAADRPRRAAPGRRRPRDHLVRRLRPRRRMRVAEKLAEDGIEAPRPRPAHARAARSRRRSRASRRHCNRVLIIHEDSRTGGIGESLAAIIQEEAFESLDAPVRIIGALDTPVPYSPPLEDFFLPSEQEIEHAARCLLRY